jgi:hypothetical protein
MSKIIKKNDIIKLSESTMRQVGLLGENEKLNPKTYMSEEGMCEGEGCMEEGSKPDYRDLDKDGNEKESMKKASKDKEEMEESEIDVVSESVKKLSTEASKHNIISENLKKELNKFNNIINYKY